MSASSSDNPAQFASAISTHEDSAAAVAQVCELACRQLGGAADWALLFVSPHHVGELERIAAQVCDAVGTENLLGCSGEAIVATGREVEHEPAVSLWLARVPQASALSMHLTFERTPEGGSIVGWPDETLDEWPRGAALLVLGEPFSFPADLLLERLNEDHPGVAVVGGMSSGGAAPGENHLVLGRRVLTEGAVATLLHGGLRVRTVVSQGCRPVGQHFVITRAERNVIFELGGKPALLRLQEVFESLPAREQELVQTGLHVGRVVSEYQERFEQGDFLVRNVMGVDQKSGAIAVGDFVRAGQTVQFHIRDEQTADSELQLLLAQVRDDESRAPRGGLLFTCNGRGTRLFSGPNHDAAAVEAALGNIPLAGFFAQGELGPVGGQNFMHGFTASLALFEELAENSVE